MGSPDCKSMHSELNIDFPLSFQGSFVRVIGLLLLFLLLLNFFFILILKYSGAEILQGESIALLESTFLMALCPCCLW